MEKKNQVKLKALRKVGSLRFNGAPLFLYGAAFRWLAHRKDVKPSAVMKGAVRLVNPLLNLCIYRMILCFLPLSEKHNTLTHYSPHFNLKRKERKH